MHYSYEIFKLWAVPCHIQILNLVGSRSMVPKLWRFNVERCVFPHNFQRPLAAKSYTSHPKKLGRRNNGKDLFYHHSMVGLGLRTQLRKDTLTFLFFCLSVNLLKVMFVHAVWPLSSLSSDMVLNR